MALVELFVNVFIAYLAFGFLFAIVFVAKGIDRVDPVTRGSKAGFRLIVLPGVAALWPLLLARLIQGGNGT